MRRSLLHSFALRGEVSHRRRSNRRMMLQALEDRAVPATFTVSNDSDGVVANPGDLPGSLRQAIFDANSTAGPDSIIFDGFFSSPQMITLSQGELLISEGVTITGPGIANLKLSGNFLSRAFNIDGPGIMPVSINKMNIINCVSTGGLVGNRGGAILIQDENVVLSEILFETNSTTAARGGTINLALSPGVLTVDKCTFNNNSTGLSAGAIHVAGGTMTLSNSTLSGNTSTGRGGALYVSGGTVTVSNCNFDLSSGNPNFSGSQGGSIVASGGSLTINKSLITGSKSAHRGAGMYVFGSANVSVLESTISNCEVTTSTIGAGGGICVLGGTILVQDTSLTGNISKHRGGGFYSTNANVVVNRCFVSGNTAVTFGGGICFTPVQNNVTHTLQSSTIEGNIAGTSGGGVAVYLGYGTQNIRNCTISGNTANGVAAGQGGGGLARVAFGIGKLFVESTIISDNSAANPVPAPDIIGTITANNTLVENPAGGTLSGLGNVTGVDPGLSAPALNGGLTKNMLPANPGPAINMGNNSAAILNDQRGQPRVAGAQTDIGAVEIQSPGIPTASISLSEVTAYGGTTYEFKVFYADDTGFDTVTFDNFDLRVTGPNGFDQKAKKVSVSGSGQNYTVTYSITPPSGAWNQNDLGVYMVASEPVQVKDDGGNSLPAATLGNFVVDGRTYLVTNNADSGIGSLRQALLNANAFQSPDTITFDPSLGGQTISLATSLTIESPVTLKGLGADKLAISGGNAVRIFAITAPARPVVNISGLTLTQGKTTGNLIADRGGAINIADEQVNISDVVFSSNSTVLARAGAVALAGSGVLNLTRCTFLSNTTGINGGAINLAGGSTTITDCVFQMNSATSFGGAIHMEASSLTLERTTLSGNTAARGGAISMSGIAAANVITIRNSTISGNTASNTDGGGGLSLTTFAGKLQVQNSTLAFNKSSNGAGGGGGISVISVSGSPTITLDSTIVSNNSGTTGPDIKGTIAAASYCWIGDPAGHTIITPTSNQNGDPELLPLANNGGLTETHALKATSLAINTGKNVTTPALTVDQRGAGFPREIGAIDIGAYEADTFTAKATAPDVSKAGDSLYTFSVTYSDVLGVDTTTLDDFDIRVTGPNSFNQLADFISVTPAGNGHPRTATYTIIPPGGDMKWDVNDIGTYTISLELDQVKNTASVSAPAGPVGTFRVGVPQSFVVTNLNDNGSGSLRDAIDLANKNAPTNDTITIDSTLSGLIPTTLGELAITDSVTIVYAGSGVISVSGGNANRVFNIDDGSTTNVLTVSITGITITQGASGDDGGGVFIANENVIFDRCVISDNSTNTQGGGIGVGTGGILTVRNSTITGNKANDVVAGYGGGVYFINNGGLLIENSTISGNSAAFQGGGVYFFGTATGGQLVIRNSTISGNTSGTEGGGVAVRSFSGNLLIQNSTVAFNTATTGFGGGVAQIGGSGSMTLESSIVAKNTNQFAPDIGASLTANNSLVGSTFGGLVAGSNNKLNVDPMLNASLASNGAPAGSPLTHALTIGSPAIDNGVNLSVLSFDQRGLGFSRTVNNATDIGAFEFANGATLPTVSSIKVNDGLSAQRSIVTSMTITFSENVTFPTGISAAFSLQRLTAPTGGSIGSVNVTGTQAGNVVTLTFLNGGAVTLDPGGSLPDGKYKLTLISNRIAGVGGFLDGTNDNVYQGTPLDDPALAFHRLFADGDGDGTVTSNDFALFRQTFGTNLNPAFDFNANNNVDSDDFSEFRKRFGLSVLP